MSVSAEISSTTESAPPPSPPAAAGLPPVRWLPLAAPAAALVVFLLALSTRHGYHLDELYSRVGTRHLAWGYVDQPPLVALVGRLEILLFGDGLTAFRIVPALLAGATVLLGGLIARELGGNQRAQVLATIVGAASGLAVHTGHIMGTNNYDVLVWVAVCWLAVRLARTRDTRLWWVIGAVVGVGLTAKNLLTLLLGCLGLGLLIFGPRGVLLSRHLFGGIGLALLIPAPVLYWQYSHDWPQVEMAKALSIALDGLARSTFVPLQFLLIGIFLSPVWIAGLVGLLRRPQWRQYRFVGVAYPLMVVLLLIVAGQGAYTSALQFVLLAAGSVVVEQWARTRVRLGLLGTSVAANAALSAVLVLPVLPIQTYAGNPVLKELAIVQFDQAGWPELTAQAAAVYRSLPPEDQARAVFYGNHYGQAGALDKYGPEYDLPPAYSGHNSYADFGRPADDKTVVITIGADRARFAELFTSCEPRGTFQIDLPVSDRGQEFMVCRGPRQPWSQMWETLRWIGFQCPYTAAAVTAESTKGCD